MEDNIEVDLLRHLAHLQLVWSCWLLKGWWWIMRAEPAGRFEAWQPSVCQRLLFFVCVMSMDTTGSG